MHHLVALLLIIVCSYRKEIITPYCAIQEVTHADCKQQPRHKNKRSELLQYAHTACMPYMAAETHGKALLYSVGGAKRHVSGWAIHRIAIVQYNNKGKRFRSIIEQNSHIAVQIRRPPPTSYI